MPGPLLTTAERERWECFPSDLLLEDLAIFFTLSASDRAQNPRRSAPANRLGFALQLCALRYLGFCPDDLSTIPPPAVAYVAQQLAVDPRSLTHYGARAHTCTDHLQAILAYTGFQKADATDPAGLAALADGACPGTRSADSSPPPRV
jgi:TnpA family transposase